jgi:hypothetical protein
MLLSIQILYQNKESWINFEETVIRGNANECKTQKNPVRYFYERVKGALTLII